MNAIALFTRHEAVIEEPTEAGCDINYGDKLYEVTYELKRIDDSFDHAFGTEHDSHVEAYDITINEVYDEDGEVTITKAQKDWLIAHVFTKAINDVVYGW